MLSNLYFSKAKLSGLDQKAVDGLFLTSFLTLNKESFKINQHSSLWLDLRSSRKHIQNKPLILSLFGVIPGSMHQGEWTEISAPSRGYVCWYPHFIHRWIPITCYDLHYQMYYPYNFNVIASSNSLQRFLNGNYWIQPTTFSYIKTVRKKKVNT